MLSALVIAAVAGVASAAVRGLQAPSAPVWPKEFTAVIEHKDFRNNRTETADNAFSVSNLGIQDDFTRFRNDTFVDFRDYKGQQEFEIFTGGNGQKQCRAQRLRGQLPIPNVNTFVYNGTVTVANTPCYRWNDPQFPELEYLDAQSTRNPVAFYDRRQEIGDLYTNFQAVTQWPAGFWTAPSNCQ